MFRSQVPFVITWSSSCRPHGLMGSSGFSPVFTNLVLTVSGLQGAATWFMGGMG